MQAFHTGLRLNMHIIKDELTPLHPVAVLDDSFELNISRVCLLQPHACDLSEDVLYVFTSSSLSYIENQQGVLNLICPECVNSEIINRKKINIICLDGTVTEYALLQRIQDIFENYRLWNQKLLDTIINKGSAHDLIDVGTEMLSNPIALFDSSLSFAIDAGQLMEHYSGTIWEQIISLECSLIDSYSDEEKKIFYSTLSTKRVPFPLETQIEDHYSKLIYNLYIEDTRVGSLVMIDVNKPFTPGQISIALHVKNLIETIIYYTNRFSLLSEHDSLINKMLKGYYVEINQVRKHLKRLMWEIEDSYYILFFESLIDNFPNEYKTHRFRICQFLTDAITVPYNGHLVMLLRAKKSSITNIPSFDSFIHFLIENSMYCGISMKFDNLLNLKYYFRQAVTAIQEGKQKNPNKVYYFYSDYFLEDIVSALKGQAELHSYCHPQILALSHSDHLSGTEYIKTLYYYLLYGRNLTEASEKLFIHRNTLKYRLSKILEIVDINLSDDRQLPHLLISCWLVDFLYHP